MGFLRHTWQRWTAGVRRAFSSYKPIDTMWRQLFEAADRGAPATRESALSIPAVLRGRNLICSFATLPLVQLDAENRRQRLPLLDQIDPDVANVVTLAQTIEDLIFDAVSWWRVTARDAAGWPTSAVHLGPGRVSLTPPGGAGLSPLPSEIDPRGAVVYVDGNPVPTSEVIRFDSPNPALLTFAGKAIRRAIALDKAATMYADEPRPAGYFAPAENAEEIDDSDVEIILAKWAGWRRRRVTGYVPGSLTYQTVDQPTPADLQLVELQRQVWLEIANAMGLDPEDLGVSTTSRTYQNDVSRTQAQINTNLAPYMEAIAGRLSMGDVTRRGYRVRWDLSRYLRADPLTRWQVRQIAHQLGAMTVEEMRDEEEWGPLPAGAAPAALPANVVPIRPGVAAAAPAAVGFSAAAPAAAVTATFSGRPHATFDLPLTQFTVDRERRVIEGTIVPYGPVASQGYRKYRFAPGSVQWGAVSRVKLLRDHMVTVPLGLASSIEERDGGPHAVFRVGRGPDGDAALLLAEDGVLDGLSVGVDFDDAADTIPDPNDRDVTLIRRAQLREVSLTAMPAFDDARVTRVAASQTGGSTVETCPTCGAVLQMGVGHTCPTPAPAAAPTPPAVAVTPPAAPLNLSADVVAQFTAWLSRQHQDAPADGPTPVNPVRAVGPQAAVVEPLPYRFARSAAGAHFAPLTDARDHLFSRDLLDMSRAGDTDLQAPTTAAGRRVAALMHATFAEVVTTDINEVNYPVNRPDMYVAQRDYRYPIWNLIGRGAPPNGVQPFLFPKFNTASGLVGDHTEGTEPSSGSFTTTSQTVTPTAISGKASITREVWDMGGNPAVSTLIWDQMRRGYREGLESAAATFLNTLTAATDIALGAGTTGDALADLWEAAVARLNFIRNYDLSAFVIEQELFVAFATAEDSTGRPLYPMLGPMNTNGQASRRYTRLDLAGVEGIPSWALASTAGSANNSWLFDPSVIWGWATPPQRLEFPGSDPGAATAPNAYAPVAYVDLAIWGYKALANTDIAGVRQVTYDTTA